MSFDHGVQERERLKQQPEQLPLEARHNWSLLSNIVLEENSHAFQSIIHHVRTNNGKRLLLPEPTKQKKRRELKLHGMSPRRRKKPTSCLPPPSKALNLTITTPTPSRKTPLHDKDILSEHKTTPPMKSAPFKH